MLPFLCTSVVIFEIKPAEKAEHELFEKFHIGFSVGKDIILGDTVHSTCDEVHNKNAALVGNVADEVFTVHERTVLDIIKKMYHVVFYEQRDNILFIHDISAVALAEAAEDRRTA